MVTLQKYTGRNGVIYFVSLCPQIFQHVMTAQVTRHVSKMPKNLGLKTLRNKWFEFRIYPITYFMHSIFLHGSLSLGSEAFSSGSVGSVRGRSAVQTAP